MDVDLHASLRNWRSALALALLVASAITLALAPVGLPDSYDWIENTTSESGAQEVNGAWAANLGFLLFGFGVMWVVRASGPRWPVSGRVLHTVFGLCMVAVAAFSIRSWETGAPYDSTEDLLHSIAATVMGFAFAIGVVVVAGARRAAGGRVAPLDVVAVVASVAIPIAMTTTDSAGLLQRLLFLFAYLWYGREAWRDRKAPVTPVALGGSAA